MKNKIVLSVFIALSSLVCTEVRGNTVKGPIGLMRASVGDTVVFGGQVEKYLPKDIRDFVRLNRWVVVEVDTICFHDKMDMKKGYDVDIALRLGARCEEFGTFENNKRVEVDGKNDRLFIPLWLAKQNWVTRLK